MKLAASVGLAALCAALGLANAASAQSYSKMVVFGDSLSDNGNIPVLGGGNNPPPPYVGNHFSNGPTYAEDLAAKLGLGTLNHFFNPAGSTDWAVGGAETQLDPQTHVYNYGNGLLPGMPQEVGGYFLSGGTLGKHDLVVAWGGANDIFSGIGYIAGGAPVNPVSYISGVAQTAATNMATYAGQFANAGAGTVVIPNMPPLGSTPQFTSGPGLAAQPLAITATTVFNTALTAGLQTDAATYKHTNFIMIDANRIENVILASPAAFGFTNVTSPCIPAGLPSCSGYSFFDGVHPTAAAHQLLAAIVDDYVTYGDRGAVTGAEGEATMRMRGHSFDTALGSVQMRDFGEARSGVGVSLEYDDATVDARTYVPHTTDTSETLRIHLDGVVSPTLRFGGQFSFSNSDVNAQSLHFKTQSVGADGVVGWRTGSLFVNGVVGAQVDDIRDVRRMTAVPGLWNTGSTRGWSGGLKAQAGTWFGMGNGWTLSPRVALTWAHGSVDGYTEAGPFDTYVYGSRSIDAASVEGTVRLQGALGPHINAHLEGGYRDYISYSGATVTTNLADNVSQPLSRDVGRPDGGVGLINAGAGGQLIKSLNWDLSYRGEFGSKYNDNLAHAGLTLPF